MKPEVAQAIQRLLNNNDNGVGYDISAQKDDDGKLVAEELESTEAACADEEAAHQGTLRLWELAKERVAVLEAAIKEHHSQKADDRCIEDDDKLYAAAGLPPCDRRVGDKLEMVKNCIRFIEKRCEGGGWPTYKELEHDRDQWKAWLLGLFRRFGPAFDASEEAPGKLFMRAYHLIETLKRDSEKFRLGEEWHHRKGLRDLVAKWRVEAATATKKGIDEADPGEHVCGSVLTLVCNAIEELFKYQNGGL